MCVENHWKGWRFWSKSHFSVFWPYFYYYTKHAWRHDNEVHFKWRLLYIKFNVSCITEMTPLGRLSGTAHAQWRADPEDRCLDCRRHTSWSHMSSRSTCTSRQPPRASDPCRHSWPKWRKWRHGRRLEPRVTRSPLWGRATIYNYLYRVNLKRQFKV